ncbi:MAG: DMT family transporter, partial [Candidatus Eisenbacteria bacterium]
MDTKKAGVLSIVAASVMWAVEPILTKLAFRTAGFLETATVRGIVVCFVALLYVGTTRGVGLRVKRGQLSKLLYIGLVGTLVADLLYVYSLGRIPVINAVLIGHLQPIFIVLFGFFVLKEDK